MQSRYYDPVTHRFINADSYASTNPTDAISCNMFAYCGNNPVNLFDPSGFAGEAISGWAGTMWWLLCIDGPIPVGDIIYGAGCLVCGIVDLVDYVGIDTIVQLFSSIPDVAASLIRQLDAAINASPPPDGPNFKKYTSRNFRYNLQQLTGESGDGMQAHHVFPQRFVNDFKDIGIEIHNPINGTWVDASHQNWSAAYNQAWANFFSANTNPTYSQAIAYARVLAREYGFTLNF